MTIRFFSACILTLAAMCAALTGCPDHTPETGGGGAGNAAVSSSGTGGLTTHTGFAGHGGVGGGVGGGGGAGMCPTGTKKCGNGCAPVGPETGCDNVPCEPCSIPNGVASCVGGKCAVGVCNQGHGDCDGDPSNGCETDLGTDSGNCGACGKACAAASACASGSCLACEDVNDCVVETGTQYFPINDPAEIVAFPYVPTESIGVENIEFKIIVSDVFLLDDAGGMPGNVLAHLTMSNMGGMNGWIPNTQLPSPVVLHAGTTYWIGMATANMVRKCSAGTVQPTWFSYSPNNPASWGFNKYSRVPPSRIVGACG